jgi:hypothetical protein
MPDYALTNQREPETDVKNPHLLIAGLIEQLPAKVEAQPDELFGGTKPEHWPHFSQSQRLKWLQMALQAFTVIYPDNDPHPSGEILIIFQSFLDQQEEGIADLREKMARQQLEIIELRERMVRLENRA